MFDSENPSKFLKIPNQIAAERIATAVLLRFGIESKDIDHILQSLLSTRNIRPLLRLYQTLMSQRDAG